MLFRSDRKAPFSKEMIISIPYKDEDGDGVVDDKAIDESTLDAYWYDEKCGEWKILPCGMVFPEENIVRVKANHFSVFGLAGDEIKNNAMPDFGDADFQESGGGGSCFIATAAFDSPMAREVVVFREFRDTYLLTSNLGKGFVNFYYYYSPPIAEFIKNKPYLKFLIRAFLKFIVALLFSIL